jgi:hypothetical protein
VGRLLKLLKLLLVLLVLLMLLMLLVLPVLLVLTVFGDGLVIPWRGSVLVAPVAAPLAAVALY